MFGTIIRSVLAASFAVALSCAGAFAADRVALVIGNGAYQFANTLPNPTNDAADITEKLKTLGFEVYGGTDLDKTGMEDQIRQFAENSSGAKVVLFFYAGHGMEADGKNYLIPVNAKLESATALRFEVVDVNVVLNFMTEEKRIAVALLDACRDNPLARSFKKKSRSTVGNGLGDVKVDQVGGGGLLFGLATAPGDTAADGEGRNSPFTKALLKHMGTPGMEFEQMMKSVKRDVDADTKGDQRPYLTSSLIEDLYLVPGAKPLDDKLTIVDPNQDPGPPKKPADQLWWEQIDGTKNVEAYEQFIKTFPNSKHVEEANSRIALLKSLEPKDEPSKDDPPPVDVVIKDPDDGKTEDPPAVDPETVAGVCPPESYRKLLMVTQLKQRGYLGMGFPTLDLTEGRVGCDAPELVAAIRQYQESISCPATGGLDEDQLAFLEGRSTTQPTCGDRNVVVDDKTDQQQQDPPADDTALADAKAAFENMRLSEDELKRSYRGLFRLNFISSESIETDFTRAEIVAAVTAFQQARGFKQTGYLTFDQVSYLVSLGAEPFANEQAEAAETQWNFGGRDWITVYNQLAAYLSYRGIDRIAGTVTRDDIKTIQQQAGIAPTGFLSPELYDYVVGQPKRFKPRNFVQGTFTTFDDWSSHRVEDKAPYCFIKSDAVSIEGQYGQGETAYMYFSYDPAWKNGNLHIRFGENIWFNTAEKIHLVAKGQRTELRKNEDGYLKPVINPKDNSVETRAFVALGGATDVELSGTSALGGPLKLYYSARGFKKAFNDMNRNCSDNKLAVWLR